MRFACAFLIAILFLPELCAQQRLSDDRELRMLNLDEWNCLNKPSGTARSGDGVERNEEKNRAPIELRGEQIPSFDHATFLQHVAEFDAQTKGKRRKDLTPAEQQQLGVFEKQVVTLTGYLNLAYPGPPETTNCASVDFHDWHLEVFEQPLDHAPRIGDPTPIICEITPRTQNQVFASGFRIQQSAGFFRRSDLQTESTGHPSRRVRVTGYLLWDDEHNGASDVGTTVQRIMPNKYHQPWRSTAWEIHPVLKIELANAGEVPPVAPSASPSAAANPAPSSLASPSVPPPSSPASPQIVTLLEPVRIQIPYGETVLPRGMKLPLNGRDAQTVRVIYMGQTVVVPLQSTDLR